MIRRTSVVTAERTGSSRRSSPLEDYRLEAAGGAAARLSAIPPRAYINVRGRPDDEKLPSATAAVLGAGVPMTPNRWQGDDERFVLWLGPDEWLAVSPEGEAADIERALRERLGDDRWLGITDLSHNYTGFLLSGACHRELLAKGCPLDLHHRAFTGGDCAQTLLAASRVLLRAVDTNTTEILVRNSFARYTADWLIDAAAEFSVDS